VLAIFGSVDSVFVYMSIRWFRTQHPQPVLAGGEGSGLAPAMLRAFFINLIAFSAFGALLVWLRYLLERKQQRVEELHAMAATGGARCCCAIYILFILRPGSSMECILSSWE